MHRTSWLLALRIVIVFQLYKLSLLNRSKNIFRVIHVLFMVSRIEKWNRSSIIFSNNRFGGFRVAIRNRSPNI